MARRRDFPAVLTEQDKAKMAPRELQCIERFVEDGFTQTEIAGQLSITQPTVSETLDRARDKINGGGGQKYTRSLEPGDIERAIAMA